MDNLKNTSAAPQPAFDEWAIIELFGHQKMAGHVTPAPIGDLLRVDVHAAPGHILYTRYISPKAVFAINPVDEEVAILMGQRLAQPPVSRWTLEDLLPKRRAKA
ncbi:MAG: hypothetical protein R3247_01410, partial [Rhodothermales bacterium]|nr:hypothetical protein [Rhodothermales bacterium]